MERGGDFSDTRGLITGEAPLTQEPQICVEVAALDFVKEDTKHNVGHFCLDCRFYVLGNKVVLFPGTHADKPSAPKILFVVVRHTQPIFGCTEHK